MHPCLLFIYRSAIDGVDKKTPGGSATESRAGSKATTTLNGLGSLTENESFNKHYNKELKVSEGKYNDPKRLFLRKLTESFIVLRTMWPRSNS